jgi:hypothetical protein
MKRILLILVGVVIGALATGAVLTARAGPGQPESIVAGTVKATNNVTACSAIGGGGGLCDITLSGNYFAAYLGGAKELAFNGTYTGKLVINWSTYAVNVNDGNEMCASISGPMTLTSGSSVLKLSVIGGASVSGVFPNSAICESPESFAPYDWNRDYGFQMQVVSGTGIFKHDVAGGPEFLGGQEYCELNSAQTAPTGQYLDSSVFPF